MTSTSRATVLCLVVVAGLVVGQPATALSVTFVVDTTTDPAPDGGCVVQGDANTCSLREAVISANANGNVEVDRIEFAPTITTATPVTLTLPNATDSTLDGDLDIMAPLEIDGDNRVIVTAAPLKHTGSGPTDRVFDIHDPEAELGRYVLRGLAVTGGLTSSDGGGIRAQVDFLELHNVHVHDNAAPGGLGGGLAWFGQGELTVSTSTFENNLARAGGGIYAETDSTDVMAVSLVDSVVVDNGLAEDDDGSPLPPVGAGIAIFGGVLEAREVAVFGNGALADPISTPGGDLVDAPATFGGGIFLDSSNAERSELVDSYVAENRADSAGAGASIHGGELVVFGTTFARNSVGPSRWGGGGLYLFGHDSTALLNNSTISGNTAPRGPAVLYEISTAPATPPAVHLVHVTVHGNQPTAELNTGDLHMATGSGEDVSAPESGFTFFNSILQGPADGLPTCYASVVGAFKSFDGNSNDDASCLAAPQPSDNSAVSQVLGELGANDNPHAAAGAPLAGGSAIVVPTNALAADAEAIDAAADLRDNGDGSPDVGGCFEPFDPSRFFAWDDQRDVARPQAAACDRGAYEAQPAATFNVCLGRPVTILGTSGDDVLRGTPGNDVVLSLGGDDVIVTGGGNDRICAGGGDDTIRAGGGRDRVHAGPGADVVRGAGGQDRIIGGPGADILIGGADADVIRGQSGNDVLKGGGGNDVLEGGGGADTLVGQGGDDTLVGRAGNDTLKGSAGNDTLKGGPGTDICRGGPGTDSLVGCER